MKKSYLFIIALALMLLIGGILAANSSEKTPLEPACEKAAPTCCNERKPGHAPGGMIWESLSLEFLTLVPIKN